MNARAILVALAFGSAVGGCGTTVQPGSHRSPTFEPGIPSFVMDGVPFIENGRTGIDVAVNAPRATFVFAMRDSGYVAPVEVLVRVLDRRGRRVVLEESWTDTLRAPDFEATQVFDLWNWNGRVEVPPGRYLLEVALESLESGGRDTRRQRVEVVNPAVPEPTLFGIRMIVRRDEAFGPFAGMHLPAGYDSLRAAVELIGARNGMEVEMRLLEHPRDTSFAVAPYYFSPSGWRLERIGIDYRRSEAIQRTIRRLEDPVEQLSIEFSLPPLPEGAYEVVVTMRVGEEELATARREFVVMPESFPRISTIDQMIEALSYIARRNEFEEIREPDDPAERRARFDAFWGSLIPNRQEATQVMQAYYSRVEEANVLFSTYKEGWKTDRGMVYIVHGAPVYRQVEPRREIWRYSYGSTMLPDFIFERYIAPELHPAFDNFILQRTPEMEPLWERAVERWREGRAE
ncbi:MAG TPA: GWxTD domain-containing protein [Rhodothermales bacterium]